ncbi:MAG: hypothetical protein U5K69_03350 [Balneolaceae bacterium]|nr:hypothetical protein [Balneolaceae bacterium]
MKIGIPQVQKIPATGLGKSEWRGKAIYSCRPRKGKYLGFYGDFFGSFFGHTKNEYTELYETTTRCKWGQGVYMHAQMHRYLDKEGKSLH